MKPLFYLLLLPNGQGEYEYAGAFQTRLKAEEKGRELARPFRIEAANSHDLEETGYA